MRIRTGMRRMTTQMLNNGRRRTGLSSRRSPLLKSAQNMGTGTSSRLNMLRASSTQSSRLLRSDYENLRKSASSLGDRAELLAEKADLGGKDMTSTAAGLVEDFNNTLKYLKKTSGVLNDYYRQTMRESALSSKTALGEVGIVVGSDGTLSLDKEILADADPEKVKAALGSSSDFIKRISAVADRAADNARAGAESVFSQYNAAGGLSGSYLSKYNFWG